MKAVMLMFDSLRKDMLSCYGNDEMITPNFDRLKKESSQFNNFYVGSMPCIPARRELHTGRYNFMHRSWGPLEPFDFSAVEIMKTKGIYTHLVTDHKHYWREGGATYHPKYNSYEFIRGQEGDSWKAVVNKKHVDLGLNESPSSVKYKSSSRNQDFVNRSYMLKEEDHPLAKTIQAGLEFIDTNHQSDEWFLQIECFDPHEPFFVPDRFLEMYGAKSGFHGWPSYYYNNQDGTTNDNLKLYYKSLITMCDDYLGRVLDYFDKYHLWDDTLLIVNTDHGFLLGEHDWWGKNIMPIYNEIANIPFFIYEPKSKKKNNCCHSIAQNIDVPATLLDFFELDKPNEMIGQSLLPLLNDDNGNRKFALFGYFGSNINITDGKYVYMHAPIKNEQGFIYEFTLMPTHINSMFKPEELKDLSLSDPLSFTQGVRTLKIPAKSFGNSNYQRFRNRLYDLQKDPKQVNKIKDRDKQLYYLENIVEIMKENDAPKELYAFYGLDKLLSIEYLENLDFEVDERNKDLINEIQFENNGLKEAYLDFIKNQESKELIIDKFKQYPLINKQMFYKIIADIIPDNHMNDVMYQLNLSMRLD